MTNTWDISSGDSVIVGQLFYKGEFKPTSFDITAGNKKVLTITNEGKLILGESFTNDEAATKFAEALLKVWKDNKLYNSELLERAKEVRTQLENGIAYEGGRSCYELDAEKTTKRMDDGVNIINELIEHIEKFYD